MPKSPRFPAWIKSRMVVFATAVTLLAIVAVIVITFALRGGSPQGLGMPLGRDNTEVLTVDRALLAEPGRDIKVSGYMVSGAGRMVLASALAESFPPQAGGATIPVAGLKMSDLVAVSSVAALNGEEPGAGDVQWTDYPVVLEGVVVNEVFEVRASPPVDDTTMETLDVRFSPVSVPISSGGQVFWALDVINNGHAAVDLTFSDGQQGEVTLGQGGDEVYAWSNGKAFDQAVKTVALQPGAAFPVVLSDTLGVKSGTYDVDASVTAMAGPQDNAAPLPDITTTLVVH